MSTDASPPAPEARPQASRAGLVRGCLILAAILVATVLLKSWAVNGGSFTAPDLTPDDVVGVWTTADGVGVLTVRADGAFTATGLTEVRDGVRSGSGTWELRQHDTYTAPGLDLRYRGFGSGVDYNAFPEFLYVWIGDPDQGERTKLFRTPSRLTGPLQPSRVSPSQPR